MKNKDSYKLRIITFGLTFLISIVSLQAQIVTKEEMDNLRYVTGFTKVGNFPAVAVAIPNEESNYVSRAAGKAYVLIANGNGWKKHKVDCLRGISLSDDGKIWYASSLKVEDVCVQAVDLSYSADGGKTWSGSNFQGFNPSSNIGTDFFVYGYR